MICVAVLGSKSFLASHWLQFSNFARSSDSKIVRYDHRIDSDGDIVRLIDTISKQDVSHVLNFIGTTDPNSPVFDLINVELPLRLLEQSEADVDVILFGSAAEYGKPTRCPVTESTALAPLTPYAKAKARQTEIFRHQESKRQAHLLRIFNTIGRAQPPGQLFHHLILRAQEAQRTEIFSIREPNLIRDFVDVRDVVAGIDSVIASNNTSFEANLCSGRPISIHDLALKMLETIKPKNRWKLEIEPSADSSPVETIWGSPGFLRKQTSWEPRTSIDDSLQWALAGLF